jgi:alanyl-tRNA synthetase
VCVNYQEDLSKLDPKKWGESVVAVIGGGGGGKGNTFSGTSTDAANVKLAVKAAQDFLEQSLGK